ncbi:MAG: acyltransferase domain-containing protein [Spirochaetota bacterium]
MEIAAVVQNLGSDAVEAFTPAWTESEACYPYPHPFFLDDAYVKDVRARAKLDAGLIDVLVRTAGIIRSDEALSHMAWHCYRLLYLKRDYYQFGKWPLFTEKLGSDAGVFYLLIVLASAERTIAIHGARGIPADITDGVLLDYGIGVARFGRFHSGKIGSPHTHVPWYRNHYDGVLFRLGRLQYVINPMRYAIRVYRNSRTHEVLALSEPGLKFTGDGFVDSIPQVNEKNGFTASLAFDGTNIIGNPILPTGTAAREKVRLPVSIWKNAVARDDMLLAMHIPEGGGMGIDKCRASMEEAFPFYEKYVPESPAKGIMCSSWIFSPEYGSFYSQDVNFVRYQHELYLFPVHSSGKDGVYFVFDREDVTDPKDLPRDSSLRIAMADRLINGGVLRSGGMFFLPEEMPKFGTQCYRSQPWVAALTAGDSIALANSDMDIAD